MDLCDDCPPYNAPDDKRCRGCPRRNVGRVLFRDATEPAVQLRVATEGLLSDQMILRLLEAAQVERFTRLGDDVKAPVVAPLVDALLACHGADQAMEAMANHLLVVGRMAQAWFGMVAKMVATQPAPIVIVKSDERR